MSYQFLPRTLISFYSAFGHVVLKPPFAYCHRLPRASSDITIWPSCSSKQFPVYKTKRGCRAGVKVKTRLSSNNFKIHPLITQRNSKSYTGSGLVRRPNFLVPVKRLESPSRTTSFPKILLSNTRSMVNKVEDISATILLNKPDIAVITESWLTPRVNDDLINIPGYSICRKDRITRVGGGLCTYIRTNLNFIELKELQRPDIECQWLLLKPTRLPRGINYIIMGTVYHPNGDDNTLRAHIFEAVDKALTDYPNSAIFLAGDFNKFKPGNLCSSFKLKQLVDRPTRGNNILDKIYSSVSTFYDKVHILPPMGMSDHSSVLLCPSVSVLSAFQAVIPKKSIQVRACKPSNKDALRCALNTYDWSPIFDLESCTDKLNFFMSVVQTAMDTHIPVRTVKVNQNDKPWITPKLRDLISKRQKAWTKGCRSTYNFYRNKCNRECKNARRRFYDDKVNNNGNVNSSRWWRQVKQLAGLSKSQSMTSMFYNDEFLSGMALAETIDASFCKVTEDIPPLPHSESDSTSLPSHALPGELIPCDYFITMESVEKALSQIERKKSMGPDCIPNWVLKDLAPILSLPISNIFNASISQGHMPILWKSADVIPIPKIPKPASVDNDLRPISLTAVLSKILEGYVFTWLCPYISEFVDPRQFGSLKGVSTTHALVHLLHRWLEATDSPKTIIRSCMIDFTKAFDRIDHNILLAKLRQMKVPSTLLNWCENFLRNRKQRVKLGNTKSSWLNTHAGVPQGTRLGPLFFLVMINDLCHDYPMYKYVDDSSTYEILSHPFDTSTIQDQVNSIVTWSSSNHMKLNVKKTKEFRVSFMKVDPVLDPIVINGQSLELVKCFKLLGVYFTSNLSWNTHVEYMCRKASKRLYILRILKRSGFSADHLRKVYCSLIRPILEYACPVWHFSLTLSNSDDVEQIQKRALKILAPGKPYNEAVAELNLQLLSERRNEICKRFYHSTLQPNSKLNELIPNQKQTGYSLRHPRTFELFKCRTTRFKNSFIPMCVRTWDDHPF